MRDPSGRTRRREYALADRASSRNYNTRRSSSWHKTGLVAVEHETARGNRGHRGPRMRSRCRRAGCCSVRCVFDGGDVPERANTGNQPVRFDATRAPASSRPAATLHNRSSGLIVYNDTVVFGRMRAKRYRPYPPRAHGGIYSRAKYCWRGDELANWPLIRCIGLFRSPFPRVHGVR